MPDNRMNIIENRLSKLVRTALLGASIITLSGCFGVESDNEIIENAGGDVVDNTQITQPDPVVLPDELIPDLTLADITVRDRPHMNTSLGYNVILSDLNTTLRGVSLSYDGGDPYNAAQIKNVPTAEQLESLVNYYGINTLHVYLEGDAEQNPDPVGINEVIADQLVELTRDAKMYLILTVGNNGENGAINSLEKTLDFWTLYGAKYKDETHVIYEAHNEPVSLDNPNWTADDWDKQAQMYDTIRSVAPDTLVLLGSFMSFSGASPAIAGADGLKALYPGIWDNAGFAFHGYWDLPSIEATIDAFEVSTDYPALLSTEFWPGDTQNGYNEAFENHHIGWMQFEWLNANDLDLGHIKNSLNTFGTVWRSETAEGSWPASGEPTIPFGENIGLYSRADDAFLNLDDANNVLAGDDNFDGEGSDTFVVVDAGNDGFIALRGANGKYLSVANYGLAMTASADTIGANEKFKWLELPSGDVALRPWGGSGHLIGTIPAGDGLEEGFTGSVGDGALLNGDNTYLVVTSTTSAPLAPLDTPTAPEPGAFYGEPMPVPTSGESVHPYNDKAPNGRLWAADFDFGGEAVAYHDNDALNKGDAYRFDEGVDVEAASEGYTAVGFFDNEEWMEYTIDVAEEGNYIVTLRTASAGGGHLSIESNCVDLTGSVATPDTGGWDVWQDMTVEVTLEAGIQKLRLVSGGGMNVMNMDIQSGGVGSVEFTDGCQWVPPVPADVRVEAEDWTTVIELPDGEVVVENTADADGEQNVGFIDAGDWMEYNVELPEYGCYIVDYRVASDTGSEGFTLSFDGILADTVTVPSTGGWQSWKSISSALELNAGLQTMRFEALGGQQNINWFEFTQADASECGVTTYGDNLITNHTFEDDTGWTVVSQDEGVFGEVTIAGGVVTFSETDIDEWQHMGVYTAVELSVGTYQFDMDMSYSDIVDTWGEVYIGLTQPVANAEYNGDQQVLVAYNSWGCGDATTYSGAATESGCDGNATPGRFEITTSGTYYLLLRSGGKTYGVNGAEFDNWALREVNPEPTLEPEPETGNLITNGTFENATGWTVVSQWGLDVEGNGVVTVADGAVTFSETTSAGWSKQMGIYTAVTLPVGTYQFDMDVTYADINELWGEVYIGSTQPVANEEYSGDQQVIKAYNSWDCGVAYSGAATEAGCDTSETPGQFEITEAGTYYLLFRSGATTYGPTGVVLDNWSLIEVEPEPEPEPDAVNFITNSTFEDDTGWTVVSQWGLDVEGNGVVTVADGVVTFSETTSAGWSKQMGIYTAVTLPVGTYQFDMDVTYADINELWGEVYIGSSEPVANEEYSGDQQVIKAYNSWDCGVAYSGTATEAGCDESATPGQFEITEAGTYYLLFRSGATTYGPTGVVLDNWTLTAVE